MKRKCLLAIFACLLGGAVWSGPPRNLLVSVRIDSNVRQEGLGMGVVIGTGGGRAGGYATESSGSRSSLQQVGVMDGGEASLSIGQTLVVPLHQVIVGGNGIRDGLGYSETVVMRDIGSGFQIKPRLKNDHVQLEISLHNEVQTAEPLATRNDRLATTVSGPLGQWLLVGGSQQQAGSRETGLIRYGTRNGAEDRRMWVKVDLAP